MFAGIRPGEGPPKQTSYLAVLPRDLDSYQPALESIQGSQTLPCRRPASRSAGLVFEW